MGGFLSLTAYREINHQLLHRGHDVAVTHWRIKTMENIKKNNLHVIVR